jgi:N4-gp56 family major capsid protein
MKQTIQEMTGETTTATTGISTVQGKEWLDSILKTAKQKMFFHQFASEYNTGKGNKEIAVPIAKTNVTFTSFSTQAAERTRTTIANLDSVVFTPVTAKLGAEISKDAVETSRVDLIAFAREQMAYDAALIIDKAFATALGAASSPAATVYGGDATETAELETGDVITTGLVAKAQRYLKANGWAPEVDKPFVLFIPAVAEETFLNDSQFINADQYGANTVVMNGEIGKYLGTKVVVTEQVPSASTWGGGSLAGHTCLLLKAKVSYGIAYREKPKMDWEYKKDEASYNIYLDMAFQCKTLQENAIVLIKVSDQ